MEGVKKTVIFTRGSEIISQKKELWTKELDKEIGVIVDGGLTVFYLFGLPVLPNIHAKTVNLSDDISMIIDEHINFVNFFVKVFYQNY